MFKRMRPDRVKYILCYICNNEEQEKHIDELNKCKNGGSECVSMGTCQY